jgi:ABC-type dipeptide/oligopeptide/nickel transport system permease component
MVINIIILLAIIWISIYSISFGVWTWKNKNKFGGMMIMLISLISLALPAYILILK